MSRVFAKKSWQTISLLLISAIVAVAVAACSTSISGFSGGGDLAIGSKNFTEQVILGELLAQHIENQTDLKVQRRLNLGGTFICHRAIVAGQIDAYVEYTGTALSAILNKKPISNPQKVYQIVAEEYRQQFNLEVGQSLGFQNTYAIVVRNEDAQKYQLKTISDLALYAPEWEAGFGYEFISREDGFPGLSDTYNLKFSSSPEIMDLGLMYRALVNNKVDAIAANSTDGLIETLNLVVLEDDKKYFPPYEAIPVIRQETLEKYPELAEVIGQISGNISAAEMRQLNYQVDGEFRKVKNVVAEFLAEKNFGQ
jgi:osmoprotectant transport system substrate-binding protein